MFITLACWLIMARRQYACKANLKVAAWSRKILFIIVMSYITKTFAHVRLTVVVTLYICVHLFLRAYLFACLLCSFLVLWLTTVSLDIVLQGLWKVSFNLLYIDNRSMPGLAWSSQVLDILSMWADNSLAKMRKNY